VVGHDGEFYSESVEVRAGEHLVESHFLATVGNSIAFGLTTDPACNQGDFLVEWFARGHSMAAANALSASCASAQEVQQSLKSQNLKHVAEQGLALRLTGQVDFAEGFYRFKGSAAGNAKAWIDGQSVLDFYADSTEERWSASQRLGGVHQVRYEFRGSDADLAASASWERVPDCGNCGWLLEYFSKPAFTEAHFVAQRCMQASKEGHLDFKESSVPQSLVGDFGVRASTTCKFAEGSYKFGVPAGKQVRLTVDGSSLIDEASSVTKADTLWATPYALAAADHRVVLEQREGGRLAEGRLSWELTQ
jgi:hypothetical protein